LDTFSVADLRGPDRKPGDGTGTNLVSGVVLDNRQPWQQGTWRDAIVRILEGEAQARRQGPHQGDHPATLPRWATAVEGTQKVTGLEAVLSKESGLREYVPERHGQRGLPLGSRSEHAEIHSGKGTAGVVSAFAESTKAVQETAPTQQPRPTTELPHPLPRILDRMVWMIQGGEQRSRIQISPPELGRLDIELYVRQGGRIQASLGAETLAVKELIESSLSQLRQQLADHGLSVEKFDVMVGLADRGFSGGESGSGAWRGEGPRRRGTRTSVARDEEESTQFVKQDRYQVDLHV
jgi:hypothetical protein